MQSVSKGVSKAPDRSAQDGPSAPQLAGTFHPAGGARQPPLAVAADAGAARGHHHSGSDPLGLFQAPWMDPYAQVGAWAWCRP